MKITHWFIRFPGGFAQGPFRSEGVTEQKARENARIIFELDRLPVGTELWREGV